MSERRSEERLPCTFRTFFQVGMPRLDCSWRWCAVDDLSPHGLQLRTRRLLDRGTPLALWMPHIGLVRGQVVHAARFGHETYRVGCVLSSRLSREGFRALQEWGAPSA